MGGITFSPEYEQALRRLYALGQGRMLPGRERLRRVLRLAGDPHLAVPAVLIGGTNGKGRLTTALSSALNTQYRTGSFIKPHLKSIRERWRVGDQAVSQAEFASAAGQALDLAAQSERESGEGISFFEACVLIGAILFRESRCEIALWEVGLGGKEDACNLCDPVLSIITNVQYDHQAILGNTLSEIARDKAYIARQGRPLLLGPPRPGWEGDYEEYAPVIRQVAGEIGADMIEVRELSEQIRRYGGERSAPDISELPQDSSALAVVGAKYLWEAGFPLPLRQFLSGLRSAHYRGRMERGALDGRPVLIDAAHNPDSMRWLGQVLESLGGREAGFPVVFGCQSSRAPEEMLAPLAGLTAALIPIAVPVLHPCPPERIAAAATTLGIPLAEGLPPAAPVAADIAIDHVTELDPPDNSTRWVEALRLGLALATEERPCVICGSIYYIGEILRTFEDGWLDGAA